MTQNETARQLDTLRGRLLSSGEPGHRSCIDGLRTGAEEIKRLEAEGERLTSRLASVETRLESVRGYIERELTLLAQPDYRSQVGAAYADGLRERLEELNQLTADPTATTLVVSLGRRRDALVELGLATIREVETLFAGVKDLTRMDDGRPEQIEARLKGLRNTVTSLGEDLQEACALLEQPRPRLDYRTNVDGAVFYYGADGVLYIIDPAKPLPGDYEPPPEALSYAFEEPPATNAPPRFEFGKVSPLPLTFEADAIDLRAARSLPEEAVARSFAALREEPEVDPDKAKGFYPKWKVERLNDPAGKHKTCSLIVLDLDHDKFALPAAKEYAIQARKGGYVRLAEDIEGELDEREGGLPHSLEASLDHIPGSVLDELEEDLKTGQPGGGEGAVWLADNLERVGILRGCFAVLAGHPPTVVLPTPTAGRLGDFKPGMDIPGAMLKELEEAVNYAAPRVDAAPRTHVTQEGEAWRLDNLERLRILRECVSAVKIVVAPYDELADPDAPAKILGDVVDSPAPVVPMDADGREALAAGLINELHAGINHGLTPTQVPTALLRLDNLRRILAEVTEDYRHAQIRERRYEERIEAIAVWIWRRLDKAIANVTSDMPTVLRFILRLATGAQKLQTPPEAQEVAAAVGYGVDTAQEDGKREPLAAKVPYMPTGVHNALVSADAGLRYGFNLLTDNDATGRVWKLDFIREALIAVQRQLRREAETEGRPYPDNELEELERSYGTPNGAGFTISAVLETIERLQALVEGEEMPAGYGLDGARKDFAALRNFARDIAPLGSAEGNDPGTGTPIEMIDRVYRGVWTGEACSRPYAAIADLKRLREIVRGLLNAERREINGDGIRSAFTLLFDRLTYSPEDSQRLQLLKDYVLTLESNVARFTADPEELEKLKAELRGIRGELSRALETLGDLERDYERETERAGHLKRENNTLRRKATAVKDVRGVLVSISAAFEGIPTGSLRMWLGVQGYAEIVQGLAHIARVLAELDAPEEERRKGAEGHPFARQMDVSEVLSGTPPEEGQSFPRSGEPPQYGRRKPGEEADAPVPPEILEAIELQAKAAPGTRYAGFKIYGFPVYVTEETIRPGQSARPLYRTPEGATTARPVLDRVTNIEEVNDLESARRLFARLDRYVRQAPYDFTNVLYVSPLDALACIERLSRYLTETAEESEKHRTHYEELLEGYTALVEENRGNVKTVGELRARQVLLTEAHARKVAELEAEVSLTDSNLLLALAAILRLRATVKAHTQMYGAYVQAIGMLEDGSIRSRRPEFVDLSPLDAAGKLLGEIKALSVSARDAGQEELTLADKYTPTHAVASK